MSRVDTTTESEVKPAMPAPRASKPRFNPFIPGFLDNPYPVYQTLREHNPFHRAMGMWIVTRHDDVMAVLGDRSFSVDPIPTETKRQTVKLGRPETPDIDKLGQKAIVFTDPPDHTRLRHLFPRPFSTRFLESRRPHIARRANELIDRMLEAREIDFVGEFADPLPLHVMSDMMNLPEEIRASIRDWTHRIRFLLEPGLMTTEVLDDVLETLANYMGYFRDLIAERRRNPGEDLISMLLDARAGEDSLTEEEVIFGGIMTFVAGHETTKCLLGNGMRALLDNPAELDRLRADPANIGSAVEEMFRYDSPLQQTKRRATRELVIRGQHLKPGDQLLLCLGAANRDPSVFPDPDRFDVARKAEGHVALGYGMHQCLGSALARLEARIAFDVLLQRASTLAPGAGASTWLSHSFIIRGPQSLPMVIAS